MRKLTINLLSILLALLLLFAAFVGWNIYQNQSFEETFYALYSDKVNGHIRMVVLSDLHQLSFGKDNAVLMERVQALQPDAVLIAGDIIEKRDPDIDFVLSLCERLQNIAPVYYGFGNHENDVVYGSDLTKSFLQQKPELVPGSLVDLSLIEQDRRLIEGLRALGVTVLQNGAVTAEFEGGTVEIGGISTGLDGFWDYSGQFVYQYAMQDTGNFKVLISHRSDVIMKYIPDYPIDLVLSGHLHGCVVRVPGKGGLYSPDQGLFPDYEAGLYESGDMTMIVSRGFAGIPCVPRILNKPEMVVVDIY